MRVGWLKKNGTWIACEGNEKFYHVLTAGLHIAAINLQLVGVFSIRFGHGVNTISGLYCDELANFKSNENPVFYWVHDVWCGGVLAEEFRWVRDGWYGFGCGYGCGYGTGTVRVQYGYGTGTIHGYGRYGTWVRFSYQRTVPMYRTDRTRTMYPK